MSTVLSLLLGIVVVLLITAATGWFVAQEFAFMAVDRSRLSVRAAAGDRASQRALDVTGRTSFMLSGAQLGITVTGLIVGYVAEPLIGESLGTMLGGVGVPTAVGIAVGTVLALLFSTVVQMVFGELVPKNLAIARPEPLARALARSTTIYLTLTGWLVTVFDSASNALLRLLRIEPVHDVEQAASARDLEHIVAESRDSGDLPPELSGLLDRILDFPTRDAAHAMVPRGRVDTVAADTPVRQVRHLMASGHSRYPVLSAESGAEQQVVGVVHLRDVLAAPWAETTVAGDLMRPALVVATLMTLPDALTEMVTGRHQLACVVDEYGDLAGILTVEDLAEELVGEITDEHDDPADPTDAIRADLDGGGWLVPGDLPLDEVERTVGRDLPRGDYETLAGLLIAGHGRLPEVGRVLEVPVTAELLDLLDDDDTTPPVARLTVVEVEHHVPSTVRIELVGVRGEATEADTTDTTEATA